MAYNASSTFTRLVDSIYIDLNANATAQTNITGAAATFYGGEVDNRLNPDKGVMFKLYDASSATNGSNPYISVYIPPASIGRFIFPEGVSFSTAVTVLVTTTVATDNTAKNPLNRVTAKLLVA
tara:strand:+ start:1280 stop:1648 length:369 start_codon:yes stop_codon:yes gene_type:complete